jgi:hypothetical protein
MTYPSSTWTVRALTDYVTGKTFYAHLVTTAPARSVTTVAGLALPVGGNYALKTLTLGTPVADGTGARVSLASGSSISWPDLITTSATNIVGMALCRQLGSSPATSDEFVAFLSNNSVTIVESCATTSGSPVVTTTNSFNAFSADSSISGTGIPVGTRILSIQSSTQLILNQRATASGTINAQIFSPATYQTKTSLGDTVNFQVPATGLIKID